MAFWTGALAWVKIVALTRGVAQRGREEYARLQEEIRASPVVYGDETGWREDGLGGYLLELQHSQGALLPTPLEPEQARG